jgi:DNA-binding PadR family transcriptional regulator
VAELTDGALRMWPATLYGTIHQLSEEGLLAPAASPEGEAEEDARRRYYELTRLGARVLAAENGAAAGSGEAAERTRALGRA